MSFAVSNPDLQPHSPLTHTASPEQVGHSVQLYADDSFLIDVMMRFIGGAVAAGDSTVVIATQAHRLKLEKRLSAHGMDIAKAATQGRYITLDAHETLPKIMVDGSVDEKRFGNIIGRVLKQARNSVRGTERPIAVFGELVALLWADAKPLQAIRLEQLWNGLAKSHSFSLLCAYPAAVFAHGKDIEPFLTMCSQHSSVVPSESYLGLDTDDERLRSIAKLQQKAEALEKE